MSRLSLSPRLRTAGLTALVLCSLILSVFAVRAVAQATGDTVVTLVPTGDVYAGELITVELVARNARNLAGYQGTVSYDQASLRLVGATVAEDLSRRGRGLLPLGPVLNEGSVALGAVTCAGPCAEVRPGNAPKSGPANGTVALGTLEFYGNAPGSYTLDLSGVKLVDPDGNTLTVRAEPVVIEVRSR